MALYVGRGMIYLKVSVYSLKAFSIIGQLAADVMAVGEDAVKMGPGPLDRHPR